MRALGVPLRTCMVLDLAGRFIVFEAVRCYMLDLHHGDIEVVALLVVVELRA
jgi:hypothetical protein